MPSAARSMLRSATFSISYMCCCLAISASCWVAHASGVALSAKVSSRTSASATTGSPILWPSSTSAGAIFVVAWHEARMPSSVRGIFSSQLFLALLTSLASEFFIV